jgi:PAS domain S-box-containing protein
VLILVLDLNGHIILLNKKGHTILGYDEGELTGKDWIATCLPSGIRDEVTGVFQRLMTGKPELVEYRENPVVTKQGAIRLIAWHNALLRDREGRIVGSLSSGDDITERKYADERIRASLREKEVLLKEIHHRVKNNLQVISSLLNMQSKHVHEDVEAFRESMNRIKSMALIHDKLYRSEDLSRIHFADYISDLSHELMSTYATERGVELELHIDPLSFDVDTAIPLGLIISELVSNCLKHAFHGRLGGRITIHLESLGDQVLLSISDNGIGFPEGIDFRNTPSLGMQLVVTLVEQLEGSVLLNKEGGTEFRIVFGAAG